MIKQETAMAIWTAYREIAASEKILNDMAEVAEQEEERMHSDKNDVKLKDVFGRKRDLQLGVPSGDNGHRIFNVKPELAECVIRAHIADKQAELVVANERARIEAINIGE